MWSLATILWSRATRAEQPSAIILAFDASSAAQKQAIAAIQAHVSGMPLEVVVSTIERQRSLDKRLAASAALAASRHALGTFYIEIAEDRSLLIFFTEAEGEATLIRRLSSNQQGLKVALEQAAIVVRSIVEALLDGGSVGIAPEGGRQTAEKTQDLTPAGPAPPPKSSPPGSPGPEQRLSHSDERPSNANSAGEASAKSAGRRIALVVGAPLTSFASGTPWQTGLSAGIHWLATPALYVGARYTLFRALTLSTADVALSVQRHPLEALLGYREPGRLGLNAEFGVVVDRVARATVRTAAPFQATSSDARWQLALGVRGGASWSPWSPMWATLRVGADVVLTPYSYAIESGEAVPSPRRIRPRVELELAFWVW